MRVLVTGSCGFIGRNICQELFATGHQWLGLDRAATNFAECGRVQDVCPDDLVDFDAIIHCAAHADVRSNWENLDTLWEENMEGTAHLLETAREAGHRGSFVFISTGAVYSECIGFVDETAQVVAASPYAASKLAGEAYLQAYAAKCGWKWYALRPAASVGPGYHHGHIADFVKQMRDTGVIRALDNGELSRPMAHVKDVATACVQLASGVAPSGVYNVAGGLWNWRSTIEVMTAMSGRAVPFELGVTSKGWLGDGSGAIFDACKLRMSGVTLPHPSLADGVKESLQGLGWP